MRINLSTCAYYRGVGTCSFGCRDEPACITCVPAEGWPNPLREMRTYAFMRKVFLRSGGVRKDLGA